MGLAGVDRRLAAILYADVVGFSRLMGEDPEDTHRRLMVDRAIFFGKIQDHRGRLVNAPGDSILAEFPSVIDALSCAVEIQEVLGSQNSALPEEQKMEFRIGINLGEVLADEAGIYGDGVNIAARLEGLATPGSICISRSVFDQVKNRIPLEYHYLGENQVKNFAEPVRAYRVGAGREAGGDPSPEGNRASQPLGRPLRIGRKRWIALGMVLSTGIILTVLMVARFAGWIGHGPPFRKGFSGMAPLELPDRPSIAVLPFDNMSGDPAQNYFSEGITEDLITDLSKVSGLFVISRNSTFTYKGRAVKPQQVSRELGVRYILEGSVRKVGNRVRINAQFIDATNGSHIWAERYDRPLEDIFTLQDEISKEIVGALRIRLTQEEASRIGSRKKANLEAYDLVLRGMEAIRVTTFENNARGEELFQKALLLDPTYAKAYLFLSKTKYQSWALQWSDDPNKLEEGLRYADRCIELDPSLAGCRAMLGLILQWKNRHDQAIAVLRRAVADSPNDAEIMASLAEVLSFAGKPMEALPMIRKAMRLDPLHPFYFLWTLAHSFYLNHDRPLAVEAFQRLKVRNPDFIPTYLYLAALYQELGQTRAALSEMAEVERLSPKTNLDLWIKRIPYKKKENMERLMNALDELKIAGKAVSSS